MKTFVQLFALVIVGACALLVSGCVSTGTYHDMEALHNQSQREADSLRDVLHSRDVTIASLNTQIDSLSANLRVLNRNYILSKSQSTEENLRLLDSLENLNANLMTREQKLKDLEHRLAARDSALNKITSTLNDALLGFKSSGLSIAVKDGKVYVSLSNQLLFSSGKTNIDKKGKEALKGLADVLNAQADINVLVEGHTDNVPVANLGEIKDNWDLSVLRATEVVRYLTVECNVDPTRMTASGHSQYSPVSMDDSNDGRAMNRRTEIILVPKLSELFQMMGK